MNARLPTNNEFIFLSHIRKQEKKRVFGVLIMLSLIFVVINTVMLIMWAEFSKNIAWLIAIGVGDLFLIFIVTALWRYPGYQIIQRPLQTVSGEFQIAEYGKKGKNRHSRVEFYIGKNNVIIPAHWLSQLEKGKEITAEFYALGNGRHIVLSIGDNLSIDKEMQDGKLVV